VEARLANIPPCLIGMEACVGAHHLSRKLASLGHDARLMPAKYVRPYSKGQKNDFNDAEAIAEAVQRPTMKFVATKTAKHSPGSLSTLFDALGRQRATTMGRTSARCGFSLVRIADSRQWRKFCRNSIRFHLLHMLATAETNLSFAS
jgi:transposase